VPSVYAARSLRICTDHAPRPTRCQRICSEARYLKLQRRSGRGLEHIRLELPTMGTVANPGTACSDPLSRTDGGCVADDRSQLAWMRLLIAASPNPSGKVAGAGNTSDEDHETREPADGEDDHSATTQQKVAPRPSPTSAVVHRRRARKGPGNRVWSSPGASTAVGPLGPERAESEGNHPKIVAPIVSSVCTRDT
jgi:hypothetical protein